MKSGRLAAELDDIKYRAHLRISELVAHHLDVKDQINEGVEVINHERWKDRYTGKVLRNPKEPVLNNIYRNEVDSLVAKIMRALDEL